MSTCPIHNPKTRVRLLVAFEALRAFLTLAIIFWWGWLLIENTQIEKHSMLFWEAITLTILVLLSTIGSLMLYLRDIKRTRALNAFFASMAHELRTPLASIRLQTEALAGKIDSPITERLTAETARLEAQIERGLELARIEGGGSLELKTVDLDESWNRSLSRLPKADHQRLTITSGKLGTAYTDDYAIEIIFRNIIENALHHAGKKAIRITTKRKGDALTISDNGKGFSGNEKGLGTLFNKGKNSKGTGIGLYLITSLMKAQGGAATFANSAKGFEVCLRFRDA